MEYIEAPSFGPDGPISGKLGVLLLMLQTIARRCVHFNPIYALLPCRHGSPSGFDNQCHLLPHMVFIHPFMGVASSHFFSLPLQPSFALSLFFPLANPQSPIE